MQPLAWLDHVKCANEVLIESFHMEIARDCVLEPTAMEFDLEKFDFRSEDVLLISCILLCFLLFNSCDIFKRNKTGNVVLSVSSCH
jgi:hypothetical protein